MDSLEMRLASFAGMSLKEIEELDISKYFKIYNELMKPKEEEKLTIND